MGITPHQDQIMASHEAHAAAANLDTSEKQDEFLNSYFSARFHEDIMTSKVESALFNDAEQGKTSIYVVFGGQGTEGSEYMSQLRSICKSYAPLVNRFLSKALHHLSRLAKNPEVPQYLFKYGFDIQSWLQDSQQEPDANYLQSAPVSCPLVGLLQLVAFSALVKALGKDLLEVRNSLRGAIGHSQGIVVAAVVSAATDWESFEALSMDALTTLFWIGIRSQEAFPYIPVPPSIAREAEVLGTGVPGPALSVRGLSPTHLQKVIQKQNDRTLRHDHISISLVNSPKNVVISGPSLILHQLGKRLLSEHRPGDEVRVQFLPMTVPFHSQHLTTATERLQHDLRDIQILSDDLATPLFNTYSGVDIRKEQNSGSNIIPMLVTLICELPTYFASVVRLPVASHAITFGPGGYSGVAGLVSRLTEGKGVRVIMADALNGTSREIGYRPELFEPDSQGVRYGVSFASDFSPCIANASDGRTLCATKMTRTLHTAGPILIAGMTPTTVSWKFVAETINAGYEIELAGGGYYNEAKFTEAISNITNMINGRRGITVNIIYANPKSVSWQIPLIAKLRSEGYPITGITIGAGVPSLETATDYILNLGLDRIGFKPANKRAIREVIRIAEDNPTFPILLQWTGGRGGGHHSDEDFHQPILALYAQIRRCSNIILIAGSGFGGADDSWPYLSGTWSQEFDSDLPLMPFDGILLGSRCMVAKEARTSPEVKELIVNTKGVEDHEWRNSTRRITDQDGIITVRSEMGEPIHKIATRGVCLWAEFDKSIFSLPRNKRLQHLQQKSVRDYVVKRLYADYQKPWFGCKDNGDLVDLHELTYAEVLRTLVKLMFVKHQKRWVDASWARMTADYALRILERMGADPHDLKLIQRLQTDSPEVGVAQILKRYPEANKQLMTHKDCRYFLQLCRRPGQKPVPFIPVLDEDFEVWFKKDSLWQSEDIDAVMDQDVQRVCVLHGPVAAKYSTVKDEPIKAMLDRINASYTSRLSGDPSSIESESARADNDSIREQRSMASVGQQTPRGIVVTRTDDCITCTVGPDAEINEITSLQWHRLLSGESGSWRHILFTAKSCRRGSRMVANPIHRLFPLIKGGQAYIRHGDSFDNAVVELGETAQEESGRYLVTVRMGPSKNQTVPVELIHHDTALGRPVSLYLEFMFSQESKEPLIWETTPSRNQKVKDFYRKVWLGDEGEVSVVSMPGSYPRYACNSRRMDEVSVERYVRAVGIPFDSRVRRETNQKAVPLDYAIVVCWKALIKLLLDEVDGDLLNLVHFSNAFTMHSDAKALQEGEAISVESEISAIAIEEAGKVVEVSASLQRSPGMPIMHVTSRFMYRGQFSDHENCFRNTIHPEYHLNIRTVKDLAIIQAKAWFHEADHEEDLIGRTLVFKLSSRTRPDGKGSFSSIKTTGIVLLLGVSSADRQHIGFVDYDAALCRADPVIDYLERWASPSNEDVLLDDPIPLGQPGQESMRIKIPSSNKAYSIASGDFNPIHTSHAFASYVNLPDTITHGMFTSAAVRNVIENWTSVQDNESSMREFDVKFVGMVLPNDTLEVQVEHFAMRNGRKLLRFKTIAVERDETVLTGQATVLQPSSVYVFTGQGAQAPNMGMDLYAKSEIAREIWDKADRHLLETYGFSILHIVRHNPKALTVHFGGPRGKAIRKAYMNLTDGSAQSKGLFKDISEDTQSYTYRSPHGLLSATQFAQPALTIMQLAAFQYARSRGVVQAESLFAGHSLGEYSALTSVADIVSIETLSSIVFYRGLCMQEAVERDAAGRSNYSMCAIDPSRVGADFDEEQLQHILRSLFDTTGEFIEIVNYNIQGRQYVCAGTLRSLDILGYVLDGIHAQKSALNPAQVEPREENHGGKENLASLLKAATASADCKPKPIQLSRGVATIPLVGIDVPFHSTYLAPRIDTFRSFLLKQIPETRIDPAKLVGKYIPNVIAKPFSLEREYLQEVYQRTKSVRIGEALRDWMPAGVASVQAVA